MTFQPNEETRAKLACAESFADALVILKDAVGGWDKLGEALGTTRFKLIRWSKGAWPRDDGLEVLRKAGVPARLLAPGAEIHRRVLRVEAELARIRELLE